MPPKTQKQKNFKLKGYLKPYTWLIILGPFFKLLEAFTEVVTPFLMAKIIDVGIVNGDKSYILTMAIWILAMNLLAVFFALICQKASTLTGEGVARKIRKDLYSHINTFSHAELDGFSTASLVNRTVNDVNQVNMAVAVTIRLVTRAPFLLIGSAVMALLIDAQMSLIFLIVLPLITFFMFFVTAKTFPRYAKSKIELDHVSNITRENLSGVRVVRAFNMEKHEISRFEKTNAKLTQIDTGVVRLTAILQPVIFLIVNFSIVGLIYWGGVRVNVGGLSQGNVIAFINYFAQISMALVSVANMVIVYTRTKTALDRIDEVFGVKNSIVSPANPVLYDPDSFNLIGAKIEFSNVSFAYKFTKDVVTNLSFCLNPGESLGIIGGTGSGKTSIVNLVPRFYDAKSGKVLIDGKNVKDYKIEDLRKIVGVVPQNAILFEGTIESNLKWRNENATESEMIKALKISQGFEFVKDLPMFLQSPVNRGGKNFSGGQRQRLTIARALVGNPRILIFDDSASALDLATDSKLRNALNFSMKNVTKIFVSQRATSLMHCDKIIVMEHGVPVDIGTHLDLLSRCPLYQEIFKSQNQTDAKKEVVVNG